MSKRRHEPAPRIPAPAHDPRDPAVATQPAWPSSADLVNVSEPWLIPGLLLIGSRLFMAAYIPFAAEDAYITFRFARNLASGHGLVFNPGERVFGFSSPLWTLWMGVGMRMGLDPVVWARASALVMDLAALVVIVSLLRRHASRLSAWCFAFFWAAWPYFGAVSVSGLENTTMVGLAALATAACAARSPLTGPGLAALALVRPEGILAACVIATQARWRDRLIALGLTGAAVAALAIYFGSPVPQSVLAKSQLYGTPGPWAGRYWWDWLTPFPFAQFERVTDLAHLFLVSVVLGPAAVLGARALWAERRTPLAAFIGACLAVWLAYALLGVAYFWWYLAVPLVGWVTLAAIGFPRLARGAALYVSVALMTLGLWTIAPKLYLYRAQNEYFGFGEVARYLSANARPGQKVMLEPIGMVGYEDPLVVVDEIGLVSPRVARRRLGGPGWYADVANDERPDWLVVRRGVLNAGQAFAGAGSPFRNLAERDSLLARYVVSAKIDTLSGDNQLVVLRRRSDR